MPLTPKRVDILLAEAIFAYLVGMGQPTGPFAQYPSPAYVLIQPKPPQPSVQYEYSQTLTAPEPVSRHYD
jgi:hypothetical protein